MEWERDIKFAKYDIIQLIIYTVKLYLIDESFDQMPNTNN